MSENEGETREKHPSWAMVGFSKITCSRPAQLFGSGTKHSHYMMMEIREATVSRDFHRNTRMGGKLIARVAMSPIQFAELLTSVNVGSGVPCTIEWLRGEGHIAYKHVEENRELIDREFGEKMEEVGQSLEAVTEDLNWLLTTPGSISKKDLRPLISKLNAASLDIQHNIPFILRQWAKSADGIAADAKASVEAFFTNALHKLGLSAAQEQFKPDSLKSLEAKEVPTKHAVARK